MQQHFLPLNVPVTFHVEVCILHVVTSIESLMSARKMSRQATLIRTYVSSVCTLEWRQIDGGVKLLRLAQRGCLPLTC